VLRPRRPWTTEQAVQWRTPVLLRFSIRLPPVDPVGTGRWREWGNVTVQGGRRHELYYVNLKSETIAASITLSPALALGPVTKLFAFQKPPAGRSGIPHDVSPRRTPSDGPARASRYARADAGLGRSELAVRAPQAACSALERS